MTPKDVKALVNDSSLSSEELLTRLEPALNNWRTRTELAKHAETLYRRDRWKFMTLLEDVVTRWDLKGDLSDWLAELDRNDDVKLHREVLAHQLRSYGWGKAYQEWVRRLTERLEREPEHRAETILDRFDCGYEIVDADAAKIFHRAPNEITALISRQVQRDFWGDIGYNLTLEAAKRTIGEDDNYWHLYRIAVGYDKWADDVKQVAQRLSETSELLAQLETMHPETRMDWPASAVYLKLLEAREDALPYVMKHAKDFPLWSTWSAGGKAWVKLLELAQTKQWWPLWSIIAQSYLSNDEFLERVKSALDDHQHGVNQLVRLAGAESNWRVHGLTAELACRLYEAHPKLLRTSFRPNLPVGLNETYVTLAAKASKSGDDTLVDFLASRAMMVVASSWQKKKPDVAWYVDHYNHIPPDALAERILAIFAQAIPPEWGTSKQLRENELFAFLMSEPRRILACLNPKDAVLSLLESRNQYVRAFALQAILESKDAVLAAHCLEPMLAATLGRIPRNVRILNYQVLSLAAQLDIATATRIEKRLRQAIRYQGPQPKDRAIECLGNVLATWPALQSPSEQPQIFGLTASP